MSAAATASTDAAGSIHSEPALIGEGGTVGPEEEVDRDLTAKIDAVIAGNDGGLLAQINELKKQQAEARKMRQKLARDLRNALRRKRRLKSKARMLSNDDLVAVLLMRKENSPGPSAHATSEPLARVDEEDPTANPPSPKSARCEE